MAIDPKRGAAQGRPGQAEPDPWMRFRFDYIGNRNIAFGVSIATMVICWGWVFATGGLKYGIDFTGGIRHIFKFDRPSTTDLLSEVRAAALTIDPASQVQNIGKEDEGEVVIQVKGFELIEKATSKATAGPVHSVDELKPRLAEFPVFDEPFYDRLRTEKATLTEDRIRKAIADHVSEATASGIISGLEKAFGKQEGKVDLNKMPSTEKLFRAVQREAVNRLAKRLLSLMPNARATADLAPVIKEAGLDPKPFEDKYLLRAPTLEEIQVDLHTLADRPDALADEILKMYPDAYKTEMMPAVQKLIEKKENRALYKSVDEAMLESAISPASIIGAILAESFYTGPFVLIKTDQVSSRIGAELREKAVVVISLSLLAMLVYIWARFELRFAVGAVITLFHDSLTMIPLMSALGYEYDINMIAAILTLIGYSLNDTIVVYDRIRENLHGMRGAALKDVIDTSIAQTLSRTVVTGVTTLLAVLALYFLGGPVLEGFSLTLFVGILVGTYSSIFVSSPIVYLWPAK